MTPEVRERLVEQEVAEVRQHAAGVEAYIREHYDPARDDALCEAHSKMVADYAGEWVVYTDSWDGQTLDRKILAHGPDFQVLLALAETWPEEVQDEARSFYCEPVIPPPAVLRSGAARTESA